MLFHYSISVAMGQRILKGLTHKRRRLENNKKARETGVIVAVVSCTIYSDYSNSKEAKSPEKNWRCYI